MDLHQQVHVVFDASGSEQLRLVFRRDTTHVGKQIVSPIFVENFKSLFRAENNVNENSVMGR